MLAVALWFLFGGLVLVLSVALRFRFLRARAERAELDALLARAELDDEIGRASALPDPVCVGCGHLHSVHVDAGPGEPSKAPGAGACVAVVETDSDGEIYCACFRFKTAAPAPLC